MSSYFLKWKSLICFSLLWLLLLILTWAHGLPYLLDSKYILDIQYVPGLLSWAYFLILACSCLSFLWLLNAPWESLSWRACFILSLSFAFVSSASLPVNTGDFFSYIEFGRMIAVHGLSPYHHGYKEIHDIYSSFSWFGSTSNYSPLALLPTLPAALVSEYSVYASFVVLKMTWFGLAVGVLFLLKTFLMAEEAKTTSRPSFNKKWFVVFTLNPLWLLEIFINGHNDIVGILILVLALTGMHKSRFQRASLWAAILPLFKTPLGIVSAFLTFRSLKRRNLRGLIVAAGSATLAIFILLAVLGDIDTMLNFLTQSAPLSLQSLVGHGAWVFQVFFMTEDLKPLWAAIIPWISPACAVAVLVMVLYSSFSKGPLSDLERLGKCMWAMVFLFSTQFWPWYGLWVLPFVVLIRRDSFFWLWLTSSFAGLFLYSPLYWEIVFQSQKEGSNIARAFYFFLPILGTLLGVILFHFRRPRENL